MWMKLEIINIIDKGITNLKNKDVHSAIKSFGNAMAQGGKNLEEEVFWVGERGLELIMNVRTSLFSAIWFYFSLHLGMQGNEQLNYLSQAQGLISFDNLILKPVVSRVFKKLQNKGKIPSRNLAIKMIALNNGMDELEKLIKDSLKKFIAISEPQKPTPEDQEKKKGDSKEFKTDKNKPMED
ncbi:MAG: hypothetical protein ACFFD2_02075 [Promethearchaeota archaeon]